MYEAFFRLNERPFAAAPLASRYFAAGAIEHARQTLHRTIDRAEGAGLIVGPSGTGKTLLLHVLAEQFRDRFTPVMLASGRLSTARALLQAILFELNLPYRQMDESELRLSLVDHLTPPKLQGEGLLLLVDEAHAMSLRLLEELRMITNLTRDGQPLMRVVMAGSPKLEERFASPRLDSFAQRLSARCYLESFSRDETAAYIRHQIQTSGGDPARVFADDALAAVYRATDGIPRLVNQVSDHALLLASLGGCSTLGAPAIEEAWADLQQLPAPWNASETTKSIATRVVEFGGLDDEKEDLPEAILFPVTATSQQPSIVEFGADEVVIPANPEQQLDRLEAQLHQLEDDFQPVGTFRPEVELIFHASHHLFGDKFEEEEVVLDRYASLEADLFDRLPAVASREGNELGQLLAPHTRQPAASTLPIQPAAAPTSEPSAAASDSADDFEPDLIVIEDNPHGSTKAAPLVKKQEYRQLFAKLRRG